MHRIHQSRRHSSSCLFYRLDKNLHSFPLSFDNFIILLFDLESLGCRAGLRSLPHNAKMHYNFANFLRDTSQPNRAILHYQLALWWVSREDLRWTILDVIFLAANFIILPTRFFFKQMKIFKFWICLHEFFGEGVYTFLILIRVSKFRNRIQCEKYININ